MFHHARDLLADICQARVEKVEDEADIPVDEAEKEEAIAEIEMAGWMRREDIELVLTILRAEDVSNIKKSGNE